MEAGLAKAWVEEIRKRFVAERVRVTGRNFSFFDGVLKEIFYIDREIHVTVIKDGDLYATHYRVRLTSEWNGNEIRWADGATANGFICVTTDGEIRFERNFSSTASVLEGIRTNLKLNHRKGLAPGLQLVNLRGRKGVAPSLLKK
jgi:hypothetical protein